MKIYNFNPETEDYCVRTFSTIKQLQELDNEFQERKKYYELRVEKLKLQLEKSKSNDHNTIVITLE